MPIQFTCPHCDQQTTVADVFAGQSGPCASCGKEISIPHLPDRPAGQAVAATKRGPLSAAAACVLVVLSVVLVALLFLPSIRTAREAARRMACTTNLKQIGEAMQAYHDRYGSFPPAYIADQEGKPMHSWRVLLLPFLGQQELYNQYDMGEPWDSSQNQAVVQRMPAVYSCPSDRDGAVSQNTSYMVVLGPSCVFDGNRATEIGRITDGIENTILVVEVAGRGVHWAEPTDLKLHELQLTGETRTPSSKHPNIFQILLADGTVRPVLDGIDLAKLRTMLRIDDDLPGLPRS